jgi:hypothetical protein
VSRIQNAVDFQKKYLDALENYENVHRPRIKIARAHYKKKAENESSYVDDDLLEAQRRQYLIDSFLKALNWRLDSDTQNEFPNLIPEAQIQSSESTNTKFLDYLGLDRQNKPLLIVETKRPNSLLPKRVNIPGVTDIRTPNEESLASIIGSGLKGDKLSEKWNEWLQTLRDYVQSAFDQSGDVPRRTVITNGTWLIIFINPADSFLSTGTSHPNNILVYENIDQNYREIFGWLEYQKVLNEAPPLLIEEIGFQILSNEVVKVLHALKLIYFERPGFFENSPRIIINPILLLRTSFNSWLIIESQTEHQLPVKIEELGSHLEDVNDKAVKLLNDLNENLKANFVPTSIEDYFEDKEAFEPFRGVTETRTYPTREEYLIITGQHTHYLQLEPTISNCPHHDWVSSRQTGNAQLVQIQSRSVENRAYFTTGEQQHCIHAGVGRAKSNPITEENRERCGLRSGDVSDPFCEIWRFETRLCCRTCIYENVCTKAVVFNLPCSKQ